MNLKTIAEMVPFCRKSQFLQKISISAEIICFCHYTAETEIKSSPLVRSAFCPMKIDHTSGLTLYPGY